LHSVGVALAEPWSTWVNRGKKGQGLIKASSGHEPALLLCSRQQEANRTPEFCYAYSDDPQTYAIKRRPRNQRDLHGTN
jgi:hypothetical protein